MIKMKTNNNNKDLPEDKDKRDHIKIWTAEAARVDNKETEDRAKMKIMKTKKTKNKKEETDQDKFQKDYYKPMRTNHNKIKIKRNNLLTILSLISFK